MRKFKLLTKDGYINPFWEIGKIYDENFIGCGSDYTVGQLQKDYPQDWQEVFEEEKVQVTTLHKDTDLGYFAGLAMQAMISRSDQNSGWSEGETSQCIYIAKELINQLNKETK